MNFIRKWLKLDPKQQSTVNESEQAPVGAEVRSESEADRSDDSSFGRSWEDQADSSVFDTGNLKIGTVGDKNTASRKAPHPEADSPGDAEEDTGFDPYNTGRFDTKSK